MEKLDFIRKVLEEGVIFVSKERVVLCLRDRAPLSLTKAQFLSALRVIVK